MPVLQFDYPGCADAAGDHTAPGQVPSWIESIGVAIDELERLSGVSDVVVVGFRLGALLAPEAISERDDVAALALLAPPPSGKAYVRELTGLARMIDGALPPFADSDEQPFDGIEAAGFRMTTETVEALRALEWQGTVRRLHGLDALLMPASVTSGITEIADSLGAAGSQATVAPFDGYNLLMCSPTANEIPWNTLDRAVDWIAGHAHPAAAAELMPATAGPLEGEGYREWPVVIGPSPEMCGVLCTPAQGKAGGEVTLILNAGAVPHIGWARGAVDMARALARDGVASLRLDLPGLGQSEDAPGKRLFLYDSRTPDDVTRAIDWLQEAGFTSVCAAGICAGAYQAFHTARHDTRIDRLVMVNPLCFSWNSSYALDMGVSKAVENARALRGKGPASAQAGEGTPGTEKRANALRGFVAKRGKRIARRTLELAKSALSGLSPARLFARGPVERWMSDITGRGAKVLVVSCDGDLSIEEIARHFGPDGERLRRMDGVTMERLPAADHTLTPAHSRTMLTAQVRSLLRSGSDHPDQLRSEAGNRDAAIRKTR